MDTLHEEMRGMENWKRMEAQIAEGQECSPQTVADLEDFLHFLQCSD